MPRGASAGTLDHYGYMLPFDFVIQGPPVSHQSRNRLNLEAWRRRVTNRAFAAWDGSDPVTMAVWLEIIYLQHAPAYNNDVDNMSKPIQDALQNVGYVNDRSVVRLTSRKHQLFRATRLIQPYPLLMRSYQDAMMRWLELLYVRVSESPEVQVLP